MQTKTTAVAKCTEKEVPSPGRLIDRQMIVFALTVILVTFSKPIEMLCQHENVLLESGE